MQSIIQFLKTKYFQSKRNKILFDEKLWSDEKPYIERKNKVDADKKETIEQSKRIHFLSWSKVLLAFLFINFTLLEFFIAWVTIHSFSVAVAINSMPDLTPLITLIGAIAGETISYGIYSAKSKAENTQGGLVYETAMYNLGNESQEDNEEV